MYINALYAIQGHYLCDFWSLKHPTFPLFAISAFLSWQLAKSIEARDKEKKRKARREANIAKARKQKQPEKPDKKTERKER